MSSGTQECEPLSPRARLSVDERERITDAATYSKQQVSFMNHPFQSLAVFLWGLMLPLCVGLFFLLCSIPPLWPFLLVYFIWIRFDPAPESGGRRFHFMRSLFLWRWFAEYFPIKIVKTAEIPPTEKYLFAYHPHGIVGLSAVGGFGSEGAGFSRIFPGIRMHVLTLVSNFTLPIYRDFLMSMGFCSVSNKSCMSILSGKPGNAITILVGGAHESLRARPGYMDLTLKRRLGFVRIAMQTGSKLVPTIAFGENDMFAQMENDDGSFLYYMQIKFKQIFRWTMPMFVGRGLLHNNMGWMPYSRPITIVVGAPIDVPHVAEPTKEQLIEWQGKYIDALLALWDKYKDEYMPARFDEMRIVD
ncbi:2-acylglycerol O-acyltransferase [Malassezia cuniculi]|uniref:Diacylglycerol O-acyltransferase n=1 Tax=Malassezia cuniculi TaxID=948313 RepID=A0AAF0ERR5_9BASI|nr:2-acylglycerol O-acyltransferase [Malassezia cuniculi]